MLGMQPADCSAFRTVMELLDRVGPRHLKQPILNDVAANVGCDKRLCCQIAHAFEYVARFDRAGSSDSHGRIHRKTSRKNGKTPEDPLFRLWKYAVAPIECRAKCLLPRQRGASTLRQQMKAIIEPIGQFTNPKHIDARGGQFDCEWNTVKPSTKVDDDGNVRIGELKCVQTCQGSFHEKLDRRKYNRLRCRK